MATYGEYTYMYMYMYGGFIGHITLALLVILKQTAMAAKNHFSFTLVFIPQIILVLV